MYPIHRARSADPHAHPVSSTSIEINHFTRPSTACVTSSHRYEGFPTSATPEHSWVYRIRRVRELSAACVRPSSHTSRRGTFESTLKARYSTPLPESYYTAERFSKSTTADADTTVGSHVLHHSEPRTNPIDDPSSSTAMHINSVDECTPPHHSYIRYSLTCKRGSKPISKHLTLRSRSKDSRGVDSAKFIEPETEASSKVFSPPLHVVSRPSRIHRTITDETPIQDPNLPLELGMCDALNRARTDPAGFATDLEHCILVSVSPRRTIPLCEVHGYLQLLEEQARVLNADELKLVDELTGKDGTPHPTAQQMKSHAASSRPMSKKDNKHTTTTSRQCPSVANNPNPEYLRSVWEQKKKELADIQCTYTKVNSEWKQYVSLLNYLRQVAQERQFVPKPLQRSLGLTFAARDDCTDYLPCEPNNSQHSMEHSEGCNSIICSSVFISGIQERLTHEHGRYGAPVGKQAVRFQIHGLGSCIERVAKLLCEGAVRDLFFRSTSLRKMGIGWRRHPLKGVILVGYCCEQFEESRTIVLDKGITPSDVLHECIRTASDVRLQREILFQSLSIWSDSDPKDQVLQHDLFVVEQPRFHPLLVGCITRVRIAFQSVLSKPSFDSMNVIATLSRDIPKMNDVVRSSPECLVTRVPHIRSNLIDIHVSIPYPQGAFVLAIFVQCSENDRFQHLGCIWMHTDRKLWIQGGAKSWPHPTLFPAYQSLHVTLVRPLCGVLSRTEKATIFEIFVRCSMDVRRDASTAQDTFEFVLKRQRSRREQLEMNKNEKVRLQRMLQANESELEYESQAIPIPPPSIEAPSPIPQRRVGTRATKSSTLLTQGTTQGMTSARKVQNASTANPTSTIKTVSKDKVTKKRETATSKNARSSVLMDPIPTANNEQEVAESLKDDKKQLLVRKISELKAKLQHLEEESRTIFETQPALQEETIRHAIHYETLATRLKRTERFGKNRCSLYVDGVQLPMKKVEERNQSGQASTLYEHYIREVGDFSISQTSFITLLIDGLQVVRWKISDDETVN